ncbi:MAG: hypothetical protein NVS9B4_28420 [Candidatus Acidiferrum sp.]
MRPENPGQLRTVRAKRGDSLWRLAERFLGQGSLWREMLPVNRSLINPTRIGVGALLTVPAATSFAGIENLPSLVKITVKRGDTLSQIAEAQLGRASYARCIADANPRISDINRIYQGQRLVIPGCTAKR